jgi:N-acetylneuraminic acid mutarotase
MTFGQTAVRTITAMRSRKQTLLLVLASLLAAPGSAADPHPSGLRLSWGTLPPLPDRLGVAGAFAGVAGSSDADRDGALLVAGGANFADRPPWDGGTKTWQTTVYALAAPDAAWIAAGRLPRPLGYGVAASFGGRVWCVGGGDADEHLRSTMALEWDAATRTVRIEPDALPPLPEAMALGGGVLVGSRLYIAGGLASPAATKALGMFCSIDLGAAAEERRWREHPTWPGPQRILPVLGTLAGKLYLVSGAELVLEPAATTTVTRRFLDDAYEFDPQTDTWHTIASCPVPLVASPGPALPLGGSRLAFLPGDDGALFSRQKELAGAHPGFPRTVHAYDPARDAWQSLGVVPDHIRSAVTTPAVAWRGGWIIPSGEVQPGTRSPQIVRVEAVDPR